MRKWTTFLMTMTVAAGLLFSTAASFGGGASCCAGKTEKASASGKCCTPGAASASSACTKSAIQQLFKDAPGTKTEFMKVDGGVALIVRAASAQYVPTVQTAMMNHLEAMKVRSETGSCASSASAAGCAASKSGKASAGASCPAGGHAASTGASCASHGSSVQKASASASAGECPDWMKVLCSTHCDVQKTAEGVKIVWTAPEASKVDQLRAAAEKLQADLVQS